MRNCWLVLCVEASRAETNKPLEDCFFEVASTEEIETKHGETAEEVVRNAWRGRTGGDVRELISEMRQFWNLPT